jgi:hypothetical protein
MSCMSNLDFAGSVTVTHTQDEEPQDTTQVQAEAEALTVATGTARCHSRINNHDQGKKKYIILHEQSLS